MISHVLFRKYLLPGFIFQSVLIGGGYGTGRELVEFFLTQGPFGGYLGMLVSMVVWCLVLAISFELSRISRSYDYRSFLNGLLGKGWMLYELLYVTMMILVISVVGAAASELLREMFGWPDLVGSIMMMVLVGILAFYGTGLIEKVLSFWSFALYAVYIILIVAVWNISGDVIRDVMTMHTENSEWFLGGIKYAGYNLAPVPALLYSVRHIERRKEAMLSGVLAGIIGIVPGVLIYTAMLSQFPHILTEAIPANYILDQLNMPIFQIAFQIMLLGTFVETGIGFIHGFNERIAKVYEEKKLVMPNYIRLVIALMVLVVAIFAATALGLIDLIASGYGTITWGFWLVFLLPLLTIGVVKVIEGS